LSRALASATVAAYFENLLPDNERILRRLRERYGVPSTSAFDMLSTLGLIASVRYSSRR
jgi:serine/threonine-protein kinase HipA